MRKPYAMGFLSILLLCSVSHRMKTDLTATLYFRMKTDVDPTANPSFSIDMKQMGIGETRGHMTATGIVPLQAALSEMKEHPDLTSTRRPEDFYPGKWLIGMEASTHTPTFRDMAHFLEVFEVGEEDDLRALVTSFEEIASSSSLGTEYKPMVLMKLRNALWKHTGWPGDMGRPITVADMVRMAHGDQNEGALANSKPAVQRSSSFEFDRAAYVNINTRTKH